MKADIDIPQIQSKVLELRNKGLRKPSRGEQIKKDERAINTLLNELLTLADWNSIFSYKTHESEKKRNKSKEELISILGDCVYNYNGSRDFINYAKGRFQNLVKDGSKTGEFADDQNDRKLHKNLETDDQDVGFDEKIVITLSDDEDTQPEDEGNHDTTEEQDDATTDSESEQEDSIDNIIANYLTKFPKRKAYIERKAKPVQIIIVLASLGMSLDNIYDFLKKNGFTYTKTDISKLQDKFREEIVGLLKKRNQ